MVVFNFANGHFIFVRAFNNQVNIYPSSFYVEQDDANAGWEGIPSVFSQELSRRSAFSDFNEENSAYITIVN